MVAAVVGDVGAGDVMAAEEVVGDMGEVGDVAAVVGDVVEVVGDMVRGEEHVDAGEIMLAEEVVGDVVAGIKCGAEKRTDLVRVDK